MTSPHARFRKTHIYTYEKKESRSSRCLCWIFCFQMWFIHRKSETRKKIETHKEYRSGECRFSCQGCKFEEHKDEAKGRTHETGFDSRMEGRKVDRHVRPDSHVRCAFEGRPSTAMNAQARQRRGLPSREDFLEGVERYSLQRRPWKGEGRRGVMPFLSPRMALGTCTPRASLLPLPQCVNWRQVAGVGGQANVSALWERPAGMSARLSAGVACSVRFCVLDGLFERTECSKDGRR